MGFLAGKKALIVGLVYGSIMAFTGRIWLLMVAHAAFDLTALAKPGRYALRARGRVEAPFDALVIQGDLSQSIGTPRSCAYIVLTP